MKKREGFTLIEVLITVLILAVGLLGLAGLQISGLKNNLSAEHRGKAGQLVYDMTDRMRSNTPGLAAYTGAALEDTNCTDVPVVGCTPTQLAGNDLFEWQEEISGALPAGVGAIVLSGAVYSVSVSWDDNRNGVVDASDASFSVGIQP